MVTIKNLEIGLSQGLSANPRAGNRTARKLVDWINAGLRAARWTVWD